MLFITLSRANRGNAYKPYRKGGSDEHEYPV